MKHFKIEEFTCPCCGEHKMDEEFLQVLDDIRDVANTPFIVTSGYRCEAHNGAVGGSPKSSHLKGVAVDISAETSWERYAIVHAAISNGISRIGISDDFIHLDDDKKPQELLWVYQ